MALSFENTGTFSLELIEQIGQGIGTTLAGLEIHASAIYDASADLLWSSGEPPPEDTQEHARLMDALDCLSLEPNRSCVERDCGQQRRMLAIPIRDPRGINRGMVVLEITSHRLGGRGDELVHKPAFAALLRRLAMALADRQHGTSTTPYETLGQSLTLYTQQLIKLRSSGRTRRYEVLLRSNRDDDPAEEAPRQVLERADDERSTGELDRHVLGALVNWMVEHRGALERAPASFTVNVSAGALRSPAFLDNAVEMLRLARLNPRMIGFELREGLCRMWPREAERFVKTCSRNKLQVVIDDFTFHTDALSLLRHQAVKLLKIDPVLTVSALTDKVAQAKVVAITQASKVLGMHCVAKRIESATARQWLAAIGVDFAQGYLLEGPLPLTELAALDLRSA